MSAGDVATYSVPNCPWCGMLSRSKPEQHREWGALRSGEAGKGAIYCGEHTAAEIPTILAAHPGYTLPSSHDF